MNDSSYKTSQSNSEMNGKKDTGEKMSLSALVYENFLRLQKRSEILWSLLN